MEKDFGLRRGLSLGLDFGTHWARVCCFFVYKAYWNLNEISTAKTAWGLGQRPILTWGGGGGLMSILVLENYSSLLYWYFVLNFKKQTDGHFGTECKNASATRFSVVFIHLYVLFFVCDDQHIRRKGMAGSIQDL